MIIIKGLPGYFKLISTDSNTHWTNEKNQATQFTTADAILAKNRLHILGFETQLINLDSEKQSDLTAMYIENNNQRKKKSRFNHADN